MALGAEVSVLEAGGVFEAEAEHAVEGDVGGPGDGDGENDEVLGGKGDSGENDRAEIGVERVVENGAATRASEIGEHGKIGHEKKDEEEQPGDVRPLKRKQAEEKDSSPFEMQQGARIEWIHGVMGAPRIV